MPHLKRLKFSNFKSWEKADIEFAPVTAFFGPNSSGKTSLIQFLLMLKQTKEATDRKLTLDFGDEKSIANLGSFPEVVFKHELNKKIEWSLDWKLDENLEINNPDKKPSILLKGKDISIFSTVELLGKSPSCTFLKYAFDGFNPEIKPIAIGQKQKFFLSPTRKDKDAKYQFVQMQGRSWPLSGPVKSYLFPDQAKTYFQNSGFLGSFEAEFESLMDKIFYLGPLRDYPHRRYEWSRETPTDMGKHGELFVPAILAARNSKQNFRSKGVHHSFERVIATWLQKLNLIHEFTIEEIGGEGNQIYRVWVKKNKQSKKVLITDVGFGVSQILPVIVLLHYVPKKSIVILEQPEIHLHPSVQSGLADIIIHAAKHRDVQVIVESHSEHLLRRLQRRIAEEKTINEQLLSHKDFKLYFCEMENGSSHLEHLNIDMFGHIRNWPKDFFGDDFGEVSAIRTAALKRKIKNASPKKQID